jgi:hypothetical protein
MSDFYGYPIRQLASKFLELECLAAAGPRIVRLKYKGRPNLFAEVPDLANPTPYGDYHYLGGHRLWHAPEAMPRSYIPDGEGLISSELPDGLILDGKTEPGTGIHKRIELRLNPERPEVSLIHTLTNEGLWEVELAPWALTMCRLGGTVIIPTLAANHPTVGLLPNRHYSLWPYSRTDDPRYHIADEFIALNAEFDLPPFKIGTYNPRGWLAYWVDGILFRKTFVVHPDLAYPDYGCNAEIYCDSHFIELESLAPLVKLAPGKSVHFSETWEFYDSLEQEFLSTKMIEFAGRSNSLLTI